MISGYLTYETESENDYYAMLGLTKSAPIGQIKRMVNQLQIMAHPDNGGSSEALARILEIKEILLDPVNRKIYDQTGLRKKELEPIAFEFAQLLLQAYEQQPDLIEYEIQETLAQLFSDNLKEIEKAFEINEKRLAVATKLTKEIETNNVFNKLLFNNFQAAKKELETNKLVMQNDMKKATARIILARSIAMQTKFRQMVSTTMSRHTGSAYHSSNSSLRSFFR